jgi:hypothetical protein
VQSPSISFTASSWFSVSLLSAASADSFMPKFGRCSSGPGSGWYDQAFGAGCPVGQATGG